MTGRQRIQWLGLLSLTLLLAAALRLYKLDAQSFWHDEGNTARLVERPIPLIIAGAAGDIHPPGYYLLLHGWRGLVGESEFALRSFSALCGFLTVAVAAAISRFVTGDARGARLATIITTFLAAVHPLAVYYSQEARMYAQLGLVTSITLWMSVRLLKQSQGRYRRLKSKGVLRLEKLEGIQGVTATLGLAFAITAGLYTHYAYSLALVALNVTFGLFWVTHALQHWRWATRWLVAHAIAGLLFVPWAPAALRASGWRPPDLGSTEAIRAVVHALVVGTSGPEQLPPIALVPVGLLVLVTLGISLRATQQTLRRFAIWSAIGLALIPPAALSGAGVYRPAYLKFLIIGVAPLAVVLGTATTGPFEPPVHNSGLLGHLHNVRSLVSLMLVVGLASMQIAAVQRIYTDPAFFRDDYRGIAQLIETQERPGDAILLSAPNQWEVFTYYYHGALPVYPAPYQATQSQAQAWTASILETHQNARLFALFWGQLESDPDSHIERALAEQAYKASDTWITTVRVVRYGVGRAPATPSAGLNASLGEQIQLLGYDLPSQTWKAGDIVPLTLFWRAEAPPPERYKVFVHLSRAGGTPAAQTDMEPGAGLAPTTTWPTNETIVDRYGIALPAELSVGTYSLTVGMYGFTGERLPIQSNGEALGDALPLTQLTVEPRDGN